MRGEESRNWRDSRGQKQRTWKWNDRGQYQEHRGGSRDQRLGREGFRITAQPPRFIRRIQEDAGEKEPTRRRGPEEKVQPRRREELQRRWTCNQPRAWRTPIRQVTKKEEEKKDMKRMEEAKELAEDEKYEILKELEQQKEQEIVHSCDVGEIANGRIHRPRKKENLNNKELYDMIFKTNENLPNILPVLTISAKLTHSGREKVTCIIDTGSNLSFIHSSLLGNTQINGNDIPTILSANSTPIEILGTKELTLEVNNIVLREKFYVTPEINSQVILGNSFLIKNRAELNYKNKQIILNLGQFSHSLPMDNKWYLRIENIGKTQNSQVNQITDIRLDEDLILAPHQHRRIPIKVASNNRIDFEPEKMLKERKKCYGYLIEDQDQQFINIYNASNFPKRIKQNTVIGFITEEGKDRLHVTEPNPKIPQVIRDPKKELLQDKDGINFDISPNLTEDQHNKVCQTLRKFKHVFTTKIEDLTPANLPPVKLETVPNHKPVNLPPYRHGKAEREQLNKLIDELLKADILEECQGTTEYASPVFLVKNKDQSPRLIGDMRGINKILKNAASATPSVKLVLSCLNNAKYFSKLDLKGAYHQLLVREEDRNLLTIKTQDRLLRYKRLTMGLKVSSTIFSKALLTLLNKILYNSCISYVDDVITFAKDFEKDLQNLEIILTIMDKANLKLNTNKCKFLYNEVDVLGYNVSQHGIKPQASNVKAILEFKRPHCVRKVRMWCGATSFFRSTIKGYSDIVAPLTDLIKDSNRNIPFKWTDQCEQAFLKIKSILTQPPLLAHFKDDWQTEVYVDSSQIGLGGSLIQINPETNKPHPVAYVSKKYTDTQKRYSNAEREMLALTYTINHFREQILGREVTVYTDCAALIHYKNFKNNSSRLNRLAMSLVDYEIIVKHKPGSKNLLADSLSRNPVDEKLDEDILQVALNLTEIKTENFEHLQAKDPFLKQIKLAKINPDVVDKKIKRNARLYEEREGLLYYKQFDGKQTKYLLAVPQEKVNEILQLFHDNKYSGGHFSNFKTAEKIKTRYHWPTLAKDVLNYTRTCESCQLKRTSTYKQFGKLIPQIPPSEPFSKITIDFYGPITGNSQNQNKYILIVTDSTTRMLFATPCRTCDARTVADKLMNLFCSYGFPREIVHDAGTHFSAQLTKHFIQALGITDRQSPPNAQHIQGMSERQNAVIRKTLSHYIENEPQKWPEMLKYVVFSYNTSVNPSTGYSPFYLFFGHEAGLPSDYLHFPENMDHDVMKQIKHVNEIRQQIAEIMKPAQNRQKQYFDRNKRDLDLKPGSEVLVKQIIDHTKPYSKFANIFRGPHTIVAKLSPVTYLVNLPKHGKLVDQAIHVSNIKPYYRR